MEGEFKVGLDRILKVRARLAVLIRTPSEVLCLGGLAGYGLALGVSCAVRFQVLETVLASFVVRGRLRNAALWPWGQE